MKQEAISLLVCYNNNAGIKRIPDKSQNQWSNPHYQKKEFFHDNHSFPENRSSSSSGWITFHSVPEITGA